MIASFYELRDKDVINIQNGERLGRICDLDIDLDCARVCSLIIPGKSKFFGLFGRSEDIIVEWKDITLIGEDVILISCGQNPPRPKPGGKWST